MDKATARLLAALAAFVVAWDEMETAWTDFQQEHDDSALVANFPFDMSFDDKGAQVSEWAGDVERALEGGAAE